LHQPCYNILSAAKTRCNTQQHTTAHCNTMQNTEIGTGWRRLIGSPKLQIIFHKRATKYRALLREMSYKDKGSYESSPPCTWQCFALNTPQHTVAHCKHSNTLQYTGTHCNTRQNSFSRQLVAVTMPQHTATHGNTLQHTAAHCPTLHQTATHTYSAACCSKHAPTPCNTQQHIAHHCNMLQHTAIHTRQLVALITTQHTATNHNALHHAASHCNTREYATSNLLQ